MAVAVIAIAASAACAPLNPVYRASEFDFYLSSLHAKALIIQSGIDSPVSAVAQRRGIPIITLTPSLTAEAGIFTLSGGTHNEPSSRGFARPDEAALALHTSGTTSRPKLVPLTHTNVCTSACTIATSLDLSAPDRCLNVMPLYHIHGLIGAALSSLAAGATMICPPGFNATDFFAWLEEFRPSWYTAVPAIHQAILSQAADHSRIIPRYPLRFIRSCSSALPPQVMVELERVFNTPVIEAYGMTEAAHQICSNPLPPGIRKVGSVGVATGCEVAVVDDEGTPVAPGELGQIVIRGANVTAGYESGPTDGPGPFTHGWFRTGDQGMLDPDGYLFIKGRLAEIIDRGGTKISPREIEEVLLDHPAVHQAAAFGIPHSTLGENVAAAVVLRHNAEATEADIRQFAAQRLADFRVPCRVLIVDDIPKGPTGKLQRTRLAERFGPLLKREFVGPRTPLESALAGIWVDVLGVGRVGIRDNFFEIGGTSLTAARMVAEVRNLTGRDIPPVALLHAPTIEELADVINRKDSSAPWPTLVAIQPKGSRPPFFCIHSVGGGVLYYRDLAQHLGSDQPLYGLQQQGLDGVQAFHSRIEDMAALYIRAIRTLQPEGPYFLGGHSFGGLVAYEVARQLCAQGRTVALLALIDTYFPDSLNAANSLRGRLIFHLESLRELGPRGYVLERAVGLTQRVKPQLSRLARRFHLGTGQRLPLSTHPATDLLAHNRRLAREYVPQAYPGRATVFLTRSWDLSRGPLKSRDPRVPRLAMGGVEIYEVSGHHGSIVQEPHVRILGEKLRACLDRAIRCAHDAVDASAQPDSH